MEPFGARGHARPTDYRARNPRAKRAGLSPRASAGVPTRVRIDKSPEPSVNTGYSGDRLWKFHSGITVPLIFHQKGS